MDNKVKVKVKEKTLRPLKKIVMPRLPVNQLQKNYAYWKINKPQLQSERKRVEKNCSNTCFLIKTGVNLKYPICTKTSCNIDCRGLTAAAKRAFLVFNNPRVNQESRLLAYTAYNKARVLGISNCKWK